MNTAARDRALLPVVKDVLGRTPISKLKVAKGPDGGVQVLLHTSRPNAVRMEQQAITQALQERIGTERAVSLLIVPEARAVAKFVRTSPRKARLVIDAIKGKRVSEAIATLRFVPNQAAELISKVLISAAANANDGWGAGAEELKIANILADGGPTLKRVRPRAQGRAYRILKRMSHITVILSEAPAPVRRTGSVPAKPKAVKAPATPKPENVAPVAQTVTEQAEAETQLDAPIGTQVEENRQEPETTTGEGSTGDSANTADAGQSATPAQTSETVAEPVTAEAPETPSGVTPAAASDAPEIDTSDRAADTDDADQKRSDGE